MSIVDIQRAARGLHSSGPLTCCFLADRRYHQVVLAAESSRDSSGTPPPFADTTATTTATARPQSCISAVPLASPEVSSSCAAAEVDTLLTLYMLPLSHREAAALRAAGPDGAADLLLYRHHILDRLQRAASEDREGGGPKVRRVEREGSSGAGGDGRAVLGEAEAAVAWVLADQGSVCYLHVSPLAEVVATVRRPLSSAVDVSTSSFELTEEVSNWETFFVALSNTIAQGAVTLEAVPLPLPSTATTPKKKAKDTTKASARTPLTAIRCSTSLCSILLSPLPWTAAVAAVHQWLFQRLALQSIVARRRYQQVLASVSLDKVDGWEKRERPGEEGGHHPYNTYHYNTNSTTHTLAGTVVAAPSLAASRHSPPPPVGTKSLMAARGPYNLVNPQQRGNANGPRGMRFQ